MKLKQKQKQKRYQRFGKKGIEWSPWFNVDEKSNEPWQLKGKLKNEYQYIEIPDDTKTT